MRDKRPVDQLSIEELEQILAIRKREARQKQLRRMQKEGRVVVPQATQQTPAQPQVDLPPELAAAVEPVEKHLNGGNGNAVQTATPVPARPQATRPPSNGNAPAFEISNEDVDPVLERRRADAERAWRRFVNGALLFVEAAAIIGLIALAVMLLGARDELRDVTEREQQSANATRMASVPTLAPTAVLRVDINDWVLPGGHTFVDGQPVQNEQELDTAGIPAHLLPRVQEQLYKPQLVRPPRTPQTAIAVSIPRLELDETIVQGSDWEALKEGVGQVQNGASPADETGNVVLAAHNDIYGQLFRYLYEMQVGDEFTIRTATDIYTYRVTGTDVVEPNQVEVMDNSGLPTATLISCYPYGVNDKRYIVFAERVG